MRTALVLLIGSFIALLIYIATAVIGGYKYNNEIESYWRLADKSSTISKKIEGIDKYIAALEKTNLQVGTNDLDIKFHELLAQYEFSKLNTLKYGTWVQDKDISTLIDWAKNELDTISMSEIIMTLPEIKNFIKSQLYKIDKLTIELVEKYFS